jgi:hypothetical protein
MHACRHGVLTEQCCRDGPQPKACAAAPQVQHSSSTRPLLTFHHLPAVQLLQLQAAIDEAAGNRALVSSVVRDAAAAGHLAFRDMKRLVKGCDALTQPATCLGELTPGGLQAAEQYMLPGGVLCPAEFKSMVLLL